MRHPRATRIRSRSGIGVLIAVPLLLLAVSRSTDGAAQTTAPRVVARIPSPGDKPEGLAWDGTSLWSNNFTNGTLYRIDPADGRILEQHAFPGLPPNPEGLTWDGTYLWTSDWQSGVISKLRPDGAGGVEIVAQFDKPEGSGPTTGLGWDGTSLWLTCWRNPPRFEFGQLYELDPDTLGVRRAIELPVLWIEDLAWDGRWFWSADWLFARVFAIDPASGDTLLTFPSPGPNPVGTAWDGRYLWLTDTATDSIYAIEVPVGADTTAVERRTWSAIKRRYRGDR